MTDLRTAAQQALEALEDLADCGAEAWSEQRPCVQIGREAITDLRAALAEPVQEPVCEVIDGRGEVDWISFVPPAGTPLYTAPPQRKPLTEEEIAALLSQSAGVDVKVNGGDLLFARAIERAHGIKP